MSRPRPRCECGRAAKALPRFGRFRSRKARAGVPRVIKGHDLCLRCFAREQDAERAKRMAQAA